MITKDKEATQEATKDILKFFTQSELDAIEQTVRQSESTISGEIVPVFVERCSNYPLALYRVGTGVAIFVLAVMVLIEYFSYHLFFNNPLWHFIIPAAAGLLTATIIHFSPNLERRIIGSNRLWRAAFNRANDFFLKEEVFDTDQRTGIMIFVAFFEHRVIVEADKGISSVVSKEEWEEVVEIIVSHIKQGETAIGIMKGIRKCAEILEKYEFIIASDDENELPDGLRVG